MKDRIPFMELPPEALVGIETVKSLYGISSATVWRRVKDGVMPTPERFGSRMTRWRVGQLRENLSKLAA